MHPQDDLLVIESLVYYSVRYADVQPARADRAWQLAHCVATAHGLTIEDALSQTLANGNGI